MSRRRLPLMLTLLLMLIAPVTVLAQSAPPQNEVYALATPLTGPDPDGFGFARVTVSLATSELCFSLSVAGISPATAADIHAGASGIDGPVTVPLAPPGPDGLVRGCVTVDARLLRTMLTEPWNSYVDVHTDEYPGGALRGQLQSLGQTFPGGPVLGNAVLEWNLHAVDTLINAPGAPIQGAGQTPTVAALHLAMVQGAVYDAVNMIAGGYQPYLAGLPEAPSTASQAAAAATAAHHVLVNVVVNPPFSPVVIGRLDMLWSESIAAATQQDGRQAVEDGIAAGEAAAHAMLAARENDGRYSAFTFTPGTEPGQWRPEPPTNIGDPFAWVAKVDPFLLESASQFRTEGPLALTSEEYATEYNEVKTLGGPTAGSPRTPEQEAIAQFFLVNPIELFNRAFRTIAAAEGLTLIEQARLFAMANMATADALIATWDDKAHWNFWRPITAIHQGDDDGNPSTVGDPNWMPLIGTPPYPEHPSGYNAVSSAFMYSAESFFGTDEMTFSLVKIVPDTQNVMREYEHFSEVFADTIEARIYQGIHFRTAEEQAVGIGKGVAEWLRERYFQPVD